MHYYAADGRKLLDAMSGLWCCKAGHCGEPIVEAIRRQAGRLDYAPAFQVGHAQLASRLAKLAPRELDHVFFCNSGSEAVDSALKIALAYHKLAGASTRTRFVSRDCSYHGSCFGGTSVGGMAPNGCPWLHLFGPSARRRRRFGRPRSLSRRGLLRAGPRARARLRQCGACAGRRAGESEIGAITEKLRRILTALR